MAPEARESQREQPEIDSPRFNRLGDAARQEVAEGRIAGAVILAGHRGEIVYRKAFGLKTLRPHREAMTVDTVFDLASVTKAVATATAIMQLVDQGQLNLDRPAAAYWPDFAGNGKNRITLRQLLTHTSGLRAEVASKVRWNGYQGALDAIAADDPVAIAGTAFRYSDVNFIVLGEIVRRVSGQALDEYCIRNIFQPLNLKDTTFKPAASLRPRIAPSDLRWGEVQDPTAYRMGGVAGNAGLFSTADDLAIFAKMLLAGGTSNGRRILTPASVANLSAPQAILGDSTLRGLGWDIRSPYSKEHNAGFPEGSFGHTGYTGTSIWINPKSQSFLIILTSRLHPDGKGNAKPLRAKAVGALASILPLGAGVPAGASPEPIMPGGGQADGGNSIQTGIQILAAEGFAPLAGKKIGLITNHTGIDADGRSTIEHLCSAPGVKLQAIFSPEHGLSGELDQKVASGRDPKTGLPIYSLYGETKKPTAKMLKDLDALVYDIQDVGVRFYTYITTLAYAMEAAASAGLDFYVLDRPNPINAALVQGPVMDNVFKSFTGYFPLPVRYGMTAGELARLFNAENHLGAKLHIVPLRGYRRNSWFDETGLPWTNPSPNIRSLDQAILYPGVAEIEATNLSVGRGTVTPFEIVGAPWISGDRLSNYLRKRNIPGIEFEPTQFSPQEAPYRLQRCEGVRLRLTDRAALDAPLLGLELASALRRLYPDIFEIDRTLGMFGSSETVDAIKQGLDPRVIGLQWQSKLNAFGRLRAKYLLY